MLGLPMLERLYLSGLGMPRCSPRQAGGGDWGEIDLGFSAEAAGHTT